MNKILTSMAAAAICVGFASCSSNEITPLSEAEQIQGQYEDHLLFSLLQS